MARGGLRLAVLPLAALATCIAAPAANAAYMDTVGYVADPGEANRVTVSFDGAFVTIADTVPITGIHPKVADPDGGNCSQPSATSVRCSYENGVALYLEDGDDSFAVAGPAPPVPSTVEFLLNVSGGGGNDSLSGSPSGDSLDGTNTTRGTPQQGGADRLIGGGGNDELEDWDGGPNFMDAGPGDDFVSARPAGERRSTVPANLQGRNTLLGGSGNDRIDGGWGDDQMNGSSGRDRLSGDEGRDRLRGGSGNDTVQGGPDEDVADGGPGNDILTASFHGGCGGPDTFIGGSGRDSLYIYCGRPTLSLRDRTRDTVDCRARTRPRRIRADRGDRLRGRCARRRR